jgi:hypothetical protein
MALHTTRVSTVRFTPLVLASEWLEAPFYFLTVNELYWKVNFSGAVIYSHKRDVFQPLHTFYTPGLHGCTPPVAEC